MKRERARRITPITVSFIPVKKRSVKIVVEDLPFNIENLNCARQVSEVSKVNVVLLLIRATSNLSSVRVISNQIYYGTCVREKEATVGTNGLVDIIIAQLNHLLLLLLYAVLVLVTSFTTRLRYAVLNSVIGP